MKGAYPTAGWRINDCTSPS